MRPTSFFLLQQLVMKDSILLSATVTFQMARMLLGASHSHTRRDCHSSWSGPSAPWCAHHSCSEAGDVVRALVGHASHSARKHTPGSLTALMLPAE